MLNGSHVVIRNSIMLRLMHSGAVSSFLRGAQKLYIRLGRANRNEHRAILTKRPNAYLTRLFHDVFENHGLYEPKQDLHRILELALGRVVCVCQSAPPIDVSPEQFPRFTK